MAIAFLQRLVAASPSVAAQAEQDGGNADQMEAGASALKTLQWVQTAFQETVDPVIAQVGCCVWWLQSTWHAQKGMR